MAQSGLHTYIAFKLRSKTGKKPWFFYSFLFGSILPDIDIVISYLLKIKNLLYYNNSNDNIYFLNSNYWFNYNLSIFHSIITLSLIYLFLLVYYEVKKKKSILNIANGIFLGISLHILVDILFFFRPVQILWPLHLIDIQPINIWGQFNIPYFFISLYLSLEFLFFRLIAFYLTEIVLNNKGTGNTYIKMLSKMMKIEGILFVLFIFIFQSPSHKTYILILYGFIYSVSLLSTIYLIYKIRFNINNFTLSIENRLDDKMIDNIRKSTIDNIG